MAKKILILGAHPDDEVLGCGGVMKQYADKGDAVYALILTNGSEVRYGDAMIETLQKEARACAQQLGVKEVFFDSLPEQKLDGIPLLDIVQKIEKVVADLKPDVVYTMHRGDINQDHGAVFEATMIAIRPVQATVREIYCYETPSSTEWGHPFVNSAFLPNVFVNIEKEIDSKVSAFSSYASQVREWPHSRSEEGIRTMAKYRGMQAHMPCAEAFMLIRKIDR